MTTVCAIENVTQNIDISSRIHPKGIQRPSRRNIKKSETRKSITLFLVSGMLCISTSEFYSLIL
jgi:hypothetical protein